MKTLYNKKGVLFPYLMSLFIIVIIFSSLSFFVHKPNSNLSATDYGNLIKSMDIQQLVSTSYSYTFDNLIEQIYLESSKEFLVYLVGIKQHEIHQCFNQGSLIIYDQRQSQLNSYNCMPDSYDTSYEDVFKKIINDKLEKIIFETKKDIKNFDINSDINYDLNSNIYEVIINYTINFNSRIAQGSSIKISKFSFEGGNYLDMVKSLLETIPKLSNLNNEISLCIEQNGISKNLCIEEIFSNYLKEKLSNHFIYEVKFQKEIDSSYYQVNFKIKVEFNGNEIELFSFDAIFEDKITFDYTQFELSNPNFDEKLFQVEIIQPSFDLNQLEGFLILYSYNNFIEDSIFENFENSLISGVLSNLKSDINFEIQNYENLDYKVFSVKDLENVSAVFVDSNNFNFENQKLKIPINQIYNSNSNSFELLNSNKKINVFVFSLKKPNNSIFQYLIDKEKMQNNLKNIFPSLNSPLPLISFDLKNLENSSGVNFGINLSFENYNQNYESLTIYFSDKAGLLTSCENYCTSHKIEISNPTSSKSILIYSSEQTIEDNLENKFDIILKKEEISNLVDFSDNQKIYIGLISNSTDRRNFFENYIKRYNYILENSNLFNYYKIEKLPQEFSPNQALKSITLRELTP